MVGKVRVLVLLETADEASAMLELAAEVDAATDIDQEICSFRRPGEETFGMDVRWLGGTSRLDPRPYRRLYRLLDDVDVVHAHPIAVGAVARVFAAIRNVPVIKTEHNTHSDYSHLKNFVNGTTNCLSDVVVTVSESTAADLRRWQRGLLRLAGVETVVIPNGINIDAVREATSSPPVTLPDGVRIGAGGRHVPQKNLQTLIDVAAVLVEEYPTLQLVITGEGPLSPALKRRVNELSLGGHVTFTGYLPERSSVHAVLGELDAYAMPSRHEGCPVAAIEAMAAGLPVVASDIPSLREVLGDAGVYAPVDDSRAFASALRTLLDDDEERQRRSAVATERAEEFHIDQTVAEYERLYRRLGE